MSFIAEATSLGDLFHRNCRRFERKTAYIRGPKSKRESLTYGQAHDAVFGYAKSLVSFGLKRGDRVALVCETCLEWALVDWACQSLGIVLVPIYPTLPEDQAMYIAQDCQASLVIVQDDKQAAKFPGMVIAQLKGEAGLLTRSSELTKADWEALTAQVLRNDLSTIIYTSGTTGQPKGAMLTHAGFIDLSNAVHDTYGIGEDDTFLSFLPLSHVFERYAGHSLPIAVGATIAYAGSIASLANDLQEFSPTIMCAVPRFFENMRQRILDNVAKQTPLQQRIFNLAFRQGLNHFRREPAPLYFLTDKLVGVKIRSRAGGRIRFFVSGGAALAPQVSDFFNAFGLTILQGYGLTETTAATCLNLPEDNRPWTVGPPLTSVEVKLAADGEILIRGSSVMLGYYNLPEATAEAIDGDAWFHSGDIGEFEGTRLKITDRKKDILVLGNGKNIAPQKIESKLKESEYINEAVLFGDGMEHCVALIVPEFDRLRHWLSEKGRESDDLEAIVQLPEIRELIKSEVDKTNKGLADFERVKKHALVGAPFTIESGELTPSLKVKRRFVRDKFATLLDSLKR